MESEIKDLEERIRNIEIEKRFQSDFIEELKKKLVDLESTRDKLTADLSAANDNIKQLDLENAEKTSQIDLLGNELGEVQQINEVQNLQIVELEKSLEKTESDLKSEIEEK